MGASKLTFSVDPIARKPSIVLKKNPDLYGRDFFYFFPRALLRVAKI